MDDIILRPFLGLSGEFSIIIAGHHGELHSIDVMAEDEYDAVRTALAETGFNTLGEITVDNEETLMDDLDPLLCFVYEPLEE